ncbi:MAG: hypothetical protein LBK95_20270 [Bifidobacteriaceae bacterium]|jgi:glycerol kinase|nr:hypothetical protein [Bifidobacteriaceae bacterium]
MSAKPAYVIGVDQGTGSTKAVAVSSDGAVAATASVPVGQHHPRPGWVEQDPAEIAASVRQALARVTSRLDGTVAAVGLSTQRESAMLWETGGGGIGPLIGWQDRRTAQASRRLTAQGHGPRVTELSGLPIDPMFSALKIAWLLGQFDPDLSGAKSGVLTAGTVDAWLMKELTNERRIEAGNASRTQLYGIDHGAWNPELLELFGVPEAVLPQVVASNEPSRPIIGVPGLHGVRVMGVLADSHAALFARGAREPGSVKATYGTGSSILGLAEPTAPAPKGLVRTIAWAAPQPRLAFEGNILSTGATLMWLGSILDLEPDAVARLAQDASADHGVDLVPAFGGLAAPWWDDSARALVTGVTLGTGRAELARAALESIALQVQDVIAAADAAVGATAGATAKIARILADGGATKNDALMQFQADIAARPVDRTDVAELSALGAAHLAGLTAGVWDADALTSMRPPFTTFMPSADPGAAVARRASWEAALDQARSKGGSTH